MAGSVNKVILLGNVGKDPEIRMLSNGQKVCNLSLATNETWRDKATGEKRDKTEWHRVVIFNDKIADIAEKYVKKGSRIYIEGELQTRKWTDNAGVERYSTEVVLQRFRGELTLLDALRGGENAGEYSGNGGNASFGQVRGGNAGVNNRAPAFGATADAPTLMDDEIPF